MTQRTVAGIALLISSVILPVSAAAQQNPKPFTQEQVQGMVHSGLGDETGAKVIGQRGLDFAPNADFLQSLKSAGANAAFLEAVRGAKHAEAANEARPINQVQVLALLASQVPNQRVATLVGNRGINFDPTDDFLQQVRQAGGEEELVAAIKSAKVTKPSNIDPQSQARQGEVRQHAARGAEFFQNNQNAEAETEYRAAVQLDPQNSDLHMALSRALNRQEKLDEGIHEAREAVRLNPNSDMAHFSLGAGLLIKGDNDEAIKEEREALRLNPGNEFAHLNVGVLLERKDDAAGATAECREALRLDPKDDRPHVILGDLRAKDRDWDGAAAEYREAVRLDPKNENAHTMLGAALAYKADWEGAIAEYREALKLNPNSELAHTDLGVALLKKSDWDGAAAEEREALRLNPNSDFAHYVLGAVLEQKHNPQEALQEYRAAYELNPKNADYQKAYERLVKQVNQ